LIMVIILGEEYKSYSFLICSFRHPPALYPSLFPIFSSAPFSQTPPVYHSPLMSETMFHSHTDPQAKLQSCIF
jgi:hypothetical protein